jgi:arylsulfatase A-like enzyme
MKCVVLMFDSLNRHYLQPYGCSWTRTPNFERLSRHSAAFTNSYICSMPCIPARRDFHTGRPNFLHRSWGPVEPFDDSLPQILKDNGIYTHLVTDHKHYWEDGGATYHGRYSTFEFVRGQEGDTWIGQVKDPEPPEREIPKEGDTVRQDCINRQLTSDPAHYPMNVTFDKGLDFIRRNHRADQWLLHLEAFDPHEPFFSQEEFREPYRKHFDAYPGKPVEWPPYREVRESPGVVNHARHEYAALLYGCDRQLGKVLDTFDALDLWSDTMLIVWTDHGFLLGEHECWGKNWTPFYNEVARTPFFIWDPRHPACAGQPRHALVQPSIDLAPTILALFGLPPAPDMTGKDLSGTIASDLPAHEYGIFGIFGGHVNITDGHHVYMRGPVSADNQPLFEYTLMPTRMRRRFTPEELAQDAVTLAPAFAFSKGCPTLKVAANREPPGKPTACERFPTMLFDLDADAAQAHPTDDPAVENRLRDALVAEMRKCDAPSEQFVRLGLP